jgi:hypothetical protein
MKHFSKEDSFLVVKFTLNFQLFLLTLHAFNISSLLKTTQQGSGDVPSCWSHYSQGCP